MTVTYLKIPARDFTLEIDAAYGASGSPDWTPIEGLTSLTLKANTNRADTTDFDSEGIAEHLLMERGQEFSVAGHYLENPLTGARPAGQVAFESFATKVGTEAYVAFRLTSPGGNIRSFIGTIESPGALGGGHNDPSGWGGSIQVSGPVTYTPA